MRLGQGRQPGLFGGCRLIIASSRWLLEKHFDDGLVDFLLEIAEASPFKLRHAERLEVRVGVLHSSGDHVSVTLFLSQLGLLTWKQERLRSSDLLLFGVKDSLHVLVDAPDGLHRPDSGREHRLVDRPLALRHVGLETEASFSFFLLPFHLSDSFVPLLLPVLLSFVNAQVFILHNLLLFLLFRPVAFAGVL